MKKDIDYLNALYPYIFVEIESQYPIKFVSFRLSKKTQEMLFKNIRIRI